MSSLLIIDDSKNHRDRVRHAVMAAGVFGEIIEAADGLQGLNRLLNGSVDVVLCDVEMPNFDGEKLLHIKLANQQTRNIPFIFLTGGVDLDRNARLLELGASDLIAKPFHTPDLVARLRLQLKTKRLHDELRLKTETMVRLSTTDAVTGLRTRRFVSDTLTIEILRARRYESPLAVLMADLDHFKQVNDEFGHLAGDAVLHGVARLLLDQIRATDVAGRYGGEEILVILSQNGRDGGQVLAERWRMSVEEAEFEAPDGRPIDVRISVGVAALEPHMTKSDELIGAADAALYLAKQRGRNQVVVAEGAPPDSTPR